MPEATKLDNQTEVQTNPALVPLVEAGVFYGRTKQKTHPRMKRFIIAVRNGVGIIDIEKTNEQLEAACAFLKEKIRHNGTVMVVGTQPAAEADVLSLATEFGLPAVTTRWLGGTLTNFKVISKRIEYFLKLKSDLESGVLKQKYTKKEVLEIERDIERMEELFGTLKNLTVRPDAVVVVDPVLHAAATHEAELMNIPVIALANTDTNPDTIPYPVVGNTKARTSIKWFLEHIAEAVREGKREALAAAAKKAESAPVVPPKA